MLVKLISAFLLPPLDLILLGMLGLALAGVRPKLGRNIAFASFLLLYLISTPFFSNHALSIFEGPYVPPAGQAEAIVVLGGGTYFDAPEYGGENTVGRVTLERLRYAARLYRMTLKPILVTGGAPLGNEDSEAAQMKEALVNDFHVPVKWAETASLNTEQNASKSAPILERNNVHSIYLVSQAWHMPRAVMMFRHEGFNVIPAPTGYTTSYRTTLLSFLPSADALLKSEILMHEVIGMAWFELKSKKHDGGNHEGTR